MRTTGFLDTAMGAISISRWRSITARLYLMIVLPMSALIIVLALGFYSMMQTHTAFHRIDDVQVPTVNAASEARAQMLIMLMNIRAFLVLGDERFVEEYEITRSEFDLALAELKDLSSDWDNPESLALLEQVQTLLEEWQTLPQHMFDLHRNPTENNALLQIHQEDIQPLFTTVLQDITRLIELQALRDPTRTNMHTLLVMADFRGSWGPSFAAVTHAIGTSERSRLDYDRYLTTNENALEWMVAQREELTTDQQVILDRLIEQRQDYIHLVDTTFTSLAQEQVKRDLVILRTQAMPLADDILTKLTILAQDQQSVLTEDVRNADRVLHITGNQQIIMGLFAALLGLLVAIALIRSLTQSFNNLIAASRAIARGNLSHRIQMESKDELGFLSRVFNQMAENLEKTVVRISENETRLDTIITYMQDGLITIDERGLIQSANQPILNLFGYASEELIGKNVQILMPNTMKKTHDAYLSEYQRTGVKTYINTRREEIAVHKDGSQIPIDLAISEGYINNQRIYIGLIRDRQPRLIAEQRRIDLALERERNSFLEETITDLSHHLRTPVAIIRTSQYLLDKYAKKINHQVQLLDAMTYNGLDDVLRNAPKHFDEHLHKIDAATNNLTRIVEDLLNLLTLDDVHHQRFIMTDLTGFVRDTLVVYQDIARQKHIELVVDVPDEGITIPLDSHLFRHALGNLLDNALQYTQEGGLVTVSIIINDQWIDIRIIDSGIGIPATDQGHIFERFYRASNANDVDASGSGLGLPIVKKIVDLHDGYIDVTSKVNIGTTFCIHLPLVTSVKPLAR